MIKIERKDTNKTRLAVEALAKAKEKGDTYNTKEVNDALSEIVNCISEDWLFWNR